MCELIPKKNEEKRKKNKQKINQIVIISDVTIRSFTLVTAHVKHFFFF